MSNVAIKVEGLGKQYQLGGRGPYKTLRESVASALTAPFRRLAPRRAVAAPASNGQPAPPAMLDYRTPPDSSFWALRDVSFEVQRGEVVGIIGRNGAGKSTLLKILSRITEPTEGEVEIIGRVGSLLEVGTGFHPELTGRENIFLNGAILGMTRGEIAAKFDEIIAFSEIERFLDTPVKFYSSGMYMRLAFAVAAHLEPEILVVDEVLAVGDAAFQKKCLGKMDSVAASGRTVFFVSHNIGAVRALCKRVIWLDGGRVRMNGDAEEVTLRYVAGGAASGGDIALSQHLRGSGDVQIARAVVSSATGTAKDTFLIGEPIRLTLDYKVRKPARGTFWLFVTTAEGTVVLSSFQRDNAEPIELNVDGSISVLIDVPAFLPGTYSIAAGIFNTGSDFLDWADAIARFEILSQFADGRSFDHRYGIITQPLNWT